MASRCCGVFIYQDLYYWRKTVLKQNIEDFIGEILTEDMRKDALEFVAYLRANGMLFERGKGYWEDKLYWMIKYESEYVCFILINGGKDKTELKGWTVWSDDSGSSWFADFPLENYLKKIAWENVDICVNCGSCENPGGIQKLIFGKRFDHVCITAMKFVNPDADALECMKKMAELRKNDILHR